MEGLGPSKPVVGSSTLSGEAKRQGWRDRDIGVLKASSRVEEKRFGQSPILPLGGIQRSARIKGTSTADSFRD